MFKFNLKVSGIVAAALTILMGVLLIVLRGEVINIALMVLGIALVVMGVMDLFARLFVPAVIKIVIGVLIAVFGSLFAGVMLYIVAAVLLIYGILELIDRIRAYKKLKGLLPIVLFFAEPVAAILIGLALLFNMGGTIAWIFIVAGVLTILDGCIMLYNVLRK